MRAETSGGVSSRSPIRMRTISWLGVTWKGKYRSSSRTSSKPFPMKRLMEYTARSAWRTSIRRAASPTTGPAGPNATTDGTSPRPSASRITWGTPRSM